MPQPIATPDAGSSTRNSPESERSWSRSWAASPRSRVSSRSTRWAPPERSFSSSTTTAPRPAASVAPLSPSDPPSHVGRHRLRADHDTPRRLRGGGIRSRRDSAGAGLGIRLGRDRMARPPRSRTNRRMPHRCPPRMGPPSRARRARALDRVGWLRIRAHSEGRCPTPIVTGRWRRYREEASKPSGTSNASWRG